MAENRVRVVCGPTAAGKSAIASALALEYGATIVSADSRQVYRGFDIGTAKPDWSERKAIRYAGIDVAEPGERFSASRWAALATSELQSAGSDGREAMVVGGTGLYIRALFLPLFAAPVDDVPRRRALERFLASRPLAELKQICAALDPSRAHLGRTQLTRAIETAWLSGRRISELHQSARREAAFVPAYLVVDPGPSLESRISTRTDAMIGAGWLDEVRSLDARIPEDAPAWKASGYRVLREVARGHLELWEARGRVIIETRQYAKRQRTWFRHQLGTTSVTTVNPDAPDAPAVVERWWKENS